MQSLLKEAYLNNDKLHLEIESCKIIPEKQRIYVLDKLRSMDITTLLEVGPENVFRFHILAKSELPQEKWPAYVSSLEQMVNVFRCGDYPVLVAEINELKGNRSLRNKLQVILILLDVKSADKITYSVRCRVEEYVRMTLGEYAGQSVLKVLDRLKLQAIKKSSNVFVRKELEYEESIIYLQYHPDYEIANSFYYIQNKEELVFDFSGSASTTVKKQIFDVLNESLKTVENTKDRRVRFLLPLKKLLAYCTESGIEDLNYMTKREMEGFRNYIDGTVGTQTRLYMQIIFNTRKHLFLSAPEVNWNATTWYMERFEFSDSRINVARPIDTLNFGSIEIVENRELLQLFTKYQLAISQKKHLQTIREQHYNLLDFMGYLEKLGVCLAKAGADIIEGYIQNLNKSDIKAASFNDRLGAVECYIDYLNRKKKTDINLKCIRRYYKKEYIHHNNRCISPEDKKKVLDSLQSFKFVLRLMFLHLWAIGPRICEVCAIKGKDYLYDGKTAWLKLRHGKMNKESLQPIPYNLYCLMVVYIRDNKITPDGYVFPNKKGGAYDAGTFSKYFKKHLVMAGITDYQFRSHDYRHSYATEMFQDGTSIQVVRDLLGHKEEDMTWNYIDYKQAVMDYENERFLKQDGGFSDAYKQFKFNNVSGS